MSMIKIDRNLRLMYDVINSKRLQRHFSNELSVKICNSNSEQVLPIENLFYL